jgi:LysM repeat protein
MGMQSNNWIALAIVSCFLTMSLGAQSQPSEPRMSKIDYIDTYRDQAIREMHSSGVPASITLAQGMLESDYGNSPLAKYARNHFGIKCHKGWEGPTFIQDDDEKNECFRKYYSVYDSYRDHSEFLRTRDRYAELFNLKTADYKGWARGLKKAGYATNPKYPDLLIKIIEENDLAKYDRSKKLPDQVPVEKVKPEPEMTTKPNALAVRTIKVSDNNIKYVIANTGDTPEAIADRHDMGRWQIIKYNDLNKNTRIVPGEIIYLQPKRRNARKTYHTVQAGETVWHVSQRFGVKIKRLIKINDLTKDGTLNAGQKVKLREVGKMAKLFAGS